MKNIKLSDYTYDLPVEKIAKYGLKDRDQSKLLFYKQGRISHHTFSQISDLLPADTTLFFNNTKVIQARLILKRSTGASIEVFLLSPANPTLAIGDTLSLTGKVEYLCMIGNLKKWQENEVLSEKLNLDGQVVNLQCRLQDKQNRIVEFSWDNKRYSFGEIIEAIGHTPLPPYIKREDEAEDKERYQTVYSKHPGAVAAPTAGLHFTEEVLNTLQTNGIRTEQLTLHVSAGTFQPIKVEEVANHPMHSEQIIISKENLLAIKDSRRPIAVGTTAMRTLESTYWYGVKILLNKSTDFHIEKLAPYQYAPESLPRLDEAAEAILQHMDTLKADSISGHTEIFIMPGYDFKVSRGLITNFHQPGSTLILLVAAFVGNDWQDIYKEALAENYRFLSYGDSSLLLPG